MMVFFRTTARIAAAGTILLTALLLRVVLSASALDSELRPHDATPWAATDMGTISYGQTVSAQLDPGGSHL